MPMFGFYRLVWLIPFLFLGACASVAKSEFLMDVDYDRYKTFVWLDRDEHTIQDPILDSGITDERVKKAVTSALLERGYILVESSPDFFVTFHTATKQQLRSVGYDVGLGYGNYRRYWRHSIHFSTGDYDVYEQGIIMIDIVDAADDRLVWRGWDVAVLNQSNYSAQQIAKDVKKILSEFPP